MKNYIFLIFMLYGIGCYAQFSRPDVNIQKVEMVELPEHFDLSEMVRKPIKKREADKYITEFDRNGNIIKKIFKDKNYTHIVSFKYQNNILVEKKTTKVPNSKAIKKSNKETLEKARNQDMTEYVLYDDVESETLYIANIDDKDRIISYKIEENIKDKETGQREYKSTFYTISYKNDKIVKIESEDDVESFFYKNDLLIKRERTFLSESSVKIVETIDYKYDERGNLIYRNPTSEAFYANKPSQKTSSFVYIDTASYDKQNRLVFHKKSLFSTRYKYDSQNRIIEKADYTDDKEVQKQEYFYVDDRMEKIVITKPAKMDIIYKYNENGVLSEKIQYTNSTNLIRAKSVYLFNDKPQILKIIDYVPVSNDKNLEFKVFKETHYEYDNNIVKIGSKDSWSKIDIVEFFN